MDITKDKSGRLLISRRALIDRHIYSERTYRSCKSKGRFKEVVSDRQPFVVYLSMPEPTRNKVIATFKEVADEYAHLLQTTQQQVADCTNTVVNFTADILEINHFYVRSSIETYILSHYQQYTNAYLNYNISTESVKGYAKQCALLQYIYDFVTRIRIEEPDARRASRILRSFKLNLQDTLLEMPLEIKMELKNDLRFNRWFDQIVAKMDAGNKPESIVQIKRLQNTNSTKITGKQLEIAIFWHRNGTNMSVPALHRKWVEYGRLQGWWMNAAGEFDPPTAKRLYQLLQPFKNPLLYTKMDAVKHYLNVVPACTRELPTKANYVWQIDGTAQNENVFDGKTVRQHIYCIKVVDTASLRMLGVAALQGVREPFKAVKEALLMAIKETGHKPAIIHCDHGPAWKELEAWCDSNDILLYPSAPGNARAKTIENIFYRFDNDITRFLAGYSGQNLTAVNSITSRPGERRETSGKRFARSMEKAMQWAKTEGITAWNERVMDTLERRPCGKTPFELYDELERYTPPLSYSQLCQICGTQHNVKLSTAGLELQHNNNRYIYFPPINTPQQRELAEHIYTTIPIDKHCDNALQIFILDEGKPAPVFTKQGKPLGIWEIKENVAYTAQFDDDDDENRKLNNMIALQKRVVNRAKEIIADNDKAIQQHPDYENIEKIGYEPLTGKRRAYTPRYDKSALLQQEMDCKNTVETWHAASQNENEISQPDDYVEVVDTDTGEIIKVRKTVLIN